MKERQPNQTRASNLQMYSRLGGMRAHIHQAAWLYIGCIPPIHLNALRDVVTGRMCFIGRCESLKVCAELAVTTKILCSKPWCGHRGMEEEVEQPCP